MSNAWEVTTDDILTVAQAHDTRLSAAELQSAHDSLDHDLIESAALAYTDFNDQVNAALSEIENQMILEGFISDPKHFPEPD